MRLLYCGWGGRGEGRAVMLPGASHLDKQGHLPLVKWPYTSEYFSFVPLCPLLVGIFHWQMYFLTILSFAKLLHF